LRLLDHLVCVSEKNCQDRARYLYTPPDHTSIVVNGVAPEEFVPADPVTLRDLRKKLMLPEKARVIGSVVRFVSEKGLNYLLDTMPAVLAQHPDTYLLLVGDGPLKGELEAQATRLGIRERVIFAGFHSDPRPYLSLFEVFVLPVPFGSMSIGLLEAMAMRRPVIITFGDKESVIHEETGLLAPPRDPEALARAIVRLLANPEVAHMYGEAARKRVEERFSAASVAHTLSTIYLACLKRRHA
jgi:glycosyltransferase involved in cell wall biosynthesis